MKTQFKVNIRANGTDSEYLLKMIGNHNEGKSHLDIDCICGYLLARRCQYLIDKPFITHENDNTIHLSDDGGKTFYLTIQECEIVELTPQFIEFDELISDAQEILNSKI